MPIDALHNAFLNFFKTIAQLDDNLNRPMGYPYLSINGQTIIYSQDAVENYVSLFPLHNALNDIYRNGITAENFTTVNEQSLSLLMRFFDHIARPATHTNNRSIMRAPIYCVFQQSHILIDYQDLILFLLNFPLEETINQLFQGENYIPAHFIFNAIQTLAREINLIALDDIPQMYQEKVIEIKNLVNIVPLNQQMTIWNEFAKFMSTRQMHVYRMIRRILTDPHVQWVFMGIMICLITSFAAPSINSKYLYIFLFIWQSIGIQLFTENPLARNAIHGAYMGSILLSALLEALITELKSNATPHDFAGFYVDTVKGIQSIFPRRDIQAAPLVIHLGMQWLSNDPKRYVPAITQGDINHVQRQIKNN